MRAQQKNCLLIISKNVFLYTKQKALLCLLSFYCFLSNAQIANYVSDGGFEVLNSNSVTTLYNVAKYWQPIDTNKDSYYIVSINSLINPAPNCSYGFQYPRNGSSFALTTFFSNVSFSPNYRGYLRNRLKQPLQIGKTYCVKFHIVNTNNSPLAIDKFGAYFGDYNLDTINYCNTPLTYLLPQVENNSGIITDTLIWTSITGTFTANGNEKYLVIGDFYSGSNTNTLLINPTYSNTLLNDSYIDDVSCIPIDLPAYAGADIWAIPGNTVYIGRPQDVGIDEACTWYNLTNTTTPVANAAGFSLTVSAITATYMVKQDICGIIKYDTVVVHASALGNVEWQMLNDKLKLYPNPANELLNVEFVTSSSEAYRDVRIKILNSLGQVIREEELTFKENKAIISTNDLANGVYVLTLLDGSTSLTTGTPPSSATRSDKKQSVSKRFVVAR